MKKIVVLISLVAFLSVSNINSMNMPYGYAAGDKDTLRVLISPELNGLLEKWITEYNEDNPDVIIHKAHINDDGNGYDLGDEDVLGIVTEDYLRSVKRGSLWSMVVARDVIVPVISADNPFRNAIIETGISPSRFADVYTEPGKLTWADISDSGDATTVNCYCLGDEPVRFCLSEFLEADNLSGNVTRVSSNEEMIERIVNDKYSIGFCRLSGIIDYENHSVREGLEIVPIDINGNGTLENNENIYSCLNDFNRGVWIGKYPGSLCRNIHMVSSTSPDDEIGIAFMQWVLSGGQEYISEAGFSELIPGEKQPKIQALNTEEITVAEKKQQAVSTARIFFIIATVVVAGILVYIITRIVKAGTEKEQEVDFSGDLKAFNEESVIIPGGVFFDRSHTWAFMEKDGNVRVGIDDFLQHVTGKVTNVKMKQPGAKIKKGEVIVSLVQHGKQLDIYSPVSGVIAEYNHDLAANSSLLNTSPFSDGWVYIIEPANWLKETRKFFMADNYREWLKSEFARLKDFISSAVKTNDLNYSQIVLQDGGEVRDKLLENFGPDVWEEFQRRYIDAASV
ncbi:MAG: hypothetical protein R6V34_04595 [Bacteroidales bacterium]